MMSSFLGNDTEVRLSRIEGKGVFALRDFEPGEVVFEWDTSEEVSDAAYGRLTDEQKRYVARHDGRWIFMQAPACYINHSCEANTNAIAGKDVVVRPIRAGEEITSDYSADMRSGDTMRCRCRAASCTGSVTGTAI